MPLFSFYRLTVCLLAVVWVPALMQAAAAETEDLVTFESSGSEANIAVRLSAVLSEVNYNAVKRMNDLAYSMANAQIAASDDEKKLEDLETSRLVGILEGVGFSEFSPLMGKTGVITEDTKSGASDVGGVLAYKAADRLLVVAFHGSRNGDPLTAFTGKDNTSDWASNLDFTAAPVVSLLEEPSPADEGIKAHQGYLRVLASMKDELYKNVTSIVATVKQERSEKPLWILFTGHSRGAGLASLAAPVVARRFAKMAAAEGQALRFGGIGFSTPAVWSSSLARDWAAQQVASSNFLRIQVQGDPVTVPLRGFVPYGIAVVERVGGVWKKTKKFRKLSDINMSPLDRWGAFHYGSNKFKTWHRCFDSDITPTLAELKALLEQQEGERRRFGIDADVSFRQRLGAYQSYEVRRSLQRFSGEALARNVGL